ncbi:MAG: Stp1/IreP family PP2C-type Ser/Thr phosphatase [Oscillospiraceae bacterium]|nr:Stp1/IreP family PP2C-type Ser/Thr phosphatase [Oscillospiraceae bacterium]
MFLASKSDIGRKRDENQDRVKCGFLGENISLTVVCDGMGGALSGGVASEEAVNVIYQRISAGFRPEAGANSIRNLMLTAVHAANTIVYEKSKEDIDKNGMGTTCVAALVCGKHCYVVNVGDSRCYLMTEGKIRQVTTDHTYVRMLYEQGLIAEDEMKTHQMRSVITRAVGVEADLEVDYFEFEPEGNFTLLLCSDGLSNYCSNEIIYGFVFGKNLDHAVTDLINYANEQGGKDNITVALVAN